ncbi:MAG: hypothetical protein WCG45_04605, partial [bacterium]
MFPQINCSSAYFINPARADASKHGGDFAKIVMGVNSTLDAVITPVKELSAVLQEMSKGNLRVNVKGDYL